MTEPERECMPVQYIEQPHKSIFLFGEYIQTDRTYQGAVCYEFVLVKGAALIVMMTDLKFEKSSILLI